MLDPYWILMMTGASRGTGINIRGDLTQGANYKIPGTLTRPCNHNLIFVQEVDQWNYV